MNEKKTVSTSDIVLASCLKYSKYNLSTIKQSGTKGIFYFDDVDESFLIDFDLGKITVEPVEFNNTVRQLTTAVKRIVSK